MALIDDIASILQTAGVGTIATTSSATGTIYKGILPEAPTAVIAVLEYEGLAPERVFAGGVASAHLEHARVQTQVRAATYQAARDTAQDVLAALDYQQNVTVNGVRYALIEALQRPPFPLANDQNNRTIFAANFAAQRNRST